MPIETQVAEAVKKNNGVIPMTEIVSRYRSESGVECIKTEDGVEIDREQVKLLFLERCKNIGVPEQSVTDHLETDTLLELAIFANVCRLFYYRDFAKTFTDIVEGKTFCETFAKQILVCPDVRIALANELREKAMGVYRKLDSNITALATAVSGVG